MNVHVARILCMVVAIGTLVVAFYTVSTNFSLFMLMMLINIISTLIGKQLASPFSMKIRLQYISSRVLTLLCIILIFLFPKFPVVWFLLIVTINIYFYLLMKKGRETEINTKLTEDRDNPPAGKQLLRMFREADPFQRNKAWREIRLRLSGKGM